MHRAGSAGVHTTTSCVIFTQIACKNTTCCMCIYTMHIHHTCVYYSIICMYMHTQYITANKYTLFQPTPATRKGKAHIGVLNNPYIQPIYNLTIVRSYIGRYIGLLYRAASTPILLKTRFYSPLCTQGQYKRQ